jgi:hypothetical protein
MTVFWGSSFTAEEFLQRNISAEKLLGKTGFSKENEE